MNLQIFSIAFCLLIVGCHADQQTTNAAIEASPDDAQNYLDQVAAEDATMKPPPEYSEIESSGLGSDFDAKSIE